MGWTLPSPPHSRFFYITGYTIVTPVVAVLKSTVILLLGYSAVLTSVTELEIRLPTDEGSQRTLDIKMCESKMGGGLPHFQSGHLWAPWEFVNTNVYYRFKAVYIQPNRVSNQGETTKLRRLFLDSGDQERPSLVSRKHWLSNVLVQWTNLESPKKHWVLVPTVWISDFIGMRHGLNIWILTCSQVVLTCLEGCGPLP